MAACVSCRASRLLYGSNTDSCCGLVGICQYSLQLLGHDESAWAATCIGLYLAKLRTHCMWGASWRPALGPSLSYYDILVRASAIILVRAPTDEGVNHRGWSPLRLQFDQFLMVLRGSCNR